MKRTAVFVVLIDFLIGAASSECKPSSGDRSPEIIIGHLRVDGVRELVVLVDPQGRPDLVRGDKATHSISGCKRDVGRQGLEPGEDEDSGDYVEFIFSKLQAGRYTLWMRPDSVVTAQLSGQRFKNPNGASFLCGPMGPEVQLEAHNWYRADVTLGAKTAADTCGFSLGVPIKAQAPSSLRAL